MEKIIKLTESELINLIVHQLVQYDMAKTAIAFIKEDKVTKLSVTGNNNGRIQREQNIQPGTPAWFKLWFGLPYMTGEKKL
jgi:hypothetical protein